MAAPKLPVITREYIRVPVTAVGSDAPVLRTLPTWLAFLADPLLQPTIGDWITGSWEPTGTPAQARCLVGPGGATVLAAGTWHVWLRVDGSAEAPKLPCGKIVVF